MTTYYAIGDVHGECDRLQHLHQLIFDDIKRHADAAAIIHLGDLVDRGPDSAGVIAHVRSLHANPPDGVQVVTLRGNHEQMMLDALIGTDHDFTVWIRNGGKETLVSYASRYGEAEAILDADIAWLKTLPTITRDVERSLVFVHAGIEPEKFPECTDEVRIWTRSERFFADDAWPDTPELAGLTVVHGHTPTDDFNPEVTARRINVDTGAVFGGPLTCVALAPGAPPRFLIA